MSIELDLNGSIIDGIDATTAFTEQTLVSLFSSATLSAKGQDNNKIDTVTITLATATPTESLGLNAAAKTAADAAGITVNYNSGTGVLTLSGSNESDSVWQAVLRGVQYDNTSNTPEGPARTVTVVATNTGTGNSSSATGTINVTAVDDPAVISGTTSGTVTEDGAVQTASGILTVSDVDAGETGFQVPAAASLTGTYGSFTFNAATGAWGYSLNNAAANVQALKGVDAATDTLSVKSADGTATQIITVHIDGSNDTASISGTTSGTVTEDGAVQTASGILTVSDVDAGETGFQVPAAASLTGTYGSFTFNAATGAWGYSLNNAAANVQALKGVDAATDTLSVKSADGTATQIITVHIDGSNDTASISGTTSGTVTEDGAVQTASGILTVSDVDAGETGFQVPAAASLTGTYGSFTFNAATGAWGYTLNNAAANVQALKGVDAATDTLSVKSADGTATHDIVVHITGVNDAPVVGNVGDLGSISEDDAGVSGNANDANLVTDPDGAPVTWQLVNVSVDHILQGANAAASLGITWNGNGSYSFNPNAFNSLGAGDSKIIEVSYQANDGAALSNTGTVSFTVTGVNDAPTLGFVQDFETGTEGVVAGGGFGAITHVPSGTGDIVTADGGYALVPETASGPFTRFDGYRAEFIDGLTASVDVYLKVDWNAGEGFEYSLAASGTDGAYQRDFVFHITKDTSRGQFLLGASNNAGIAPVEAIAVTDSGWYTLQQVFRKADDHLAVDFSLIGADGDILWSTTIETTDAIPAEVGGNRYGWFTDVTVSGGLAIDNLTLGEFSGAVTESLGEGSADLTADGVVPFSDVDIGDSHEVIVAPRGSGYLGTFEATVDNSATLDGEGTVTWSFVAADSAVEHLGEGDTLAQVYTVTVNDGHGGTVSQDVTITITGSNDAPTLTGPQGTLPVGAEGVAYTITASDLLAGFTDVDGDTLSVSGLTANHGSLVGNPDGTWTFTPAANYNGPVALSYTVIDGHGGSTLANQSFSLEGRDPNSFFSTNGYLSANPDVAAAGMDPLQHYHQFGWKEGRDPSANFDTSLYLLRNPDVAAAGVDPLAHFLEFGMAEGRASSAAIGATVSEGFDFEFYLLANPDVGLAGVNALTHYNTFGWHEGRNPNAYFDTAGYLAHNPDVAAAGVNPLEHYDQYGWKEGRDPSGAFDTAAYLAANPDVAAAHVDPLQHYLTYGIYEGRSSFGDGMFG